MDKKENACKRFKQTSTSDTTQIHAGSILIVFIMRVLIETFVRSSICLIIAKIYKQKFSNIQIYSTVENLDTAAH